MTKDRNAGSHTVHGRDKPVCVEEPSSSTSKLFSQSHSTEITYNSCIWHAGCSPDKGSLLNQAVIYEFDFFLFFLSFTKQMLR